MTENLRTYIAMVVDRSGSMDTIRDDTIGGINTFLTEQQKDPENVRFTYAQFDNVYEIVHDNISLAEVPQLTRDDFVPRSSTALLDAIGKTINRVSSFIAAQPEAERPEKVVIVIVTDGYENASREFTRSAIFELITSKQTNDDWQIIYLAANQDAIAQARTYGIYGTHAMNFSPGARGTAAVYTAASSNISNVKKGFAEGIKFSAYERHMSTADSAELQKQAVEQFTAAGIDVSGQDADGVEVSDSVSVTVGQTDSDTVTSTPGEGDKSST